MPTSLNDGAWHTLEIVRTANAITITVDGDTTSQDIAGSAVNDGQFVVGGLSTGDVAFAGSMDYLVFHRGSTTRAHLLEGLSVNVKGPAILMIEWQLWHRSGAMTWSP